MLIEKGRIGGHKPAHAGTKVPGSEVVKPGFGIAFFAGEFVTKKRGTRRVFVHADQRIVVVAESVIGSLAPFGFTASEELTDFSGSAQSSSCSSIS